jgi:peptidyl-prolyl cis-trans isomerase C
VIVPEAERLAAVNQGKVSTTDVELAVQELKRFMAAVRQEWKPLPAQDDPNALDLQDVMNNLVESELKAQDARARGLDRRSDVQRRFAYLQRNFYAQEWDRWQQEHASPTDDEVHQFYEQNKAGFIDPERIKVRQLVTNTLAEAETLRAQAVQGAVFAQLAREQSVGAGKEQGGDVGWFLRAVDAERLRLLGEPAEANVFFPQLEPVAFSLEVNQVSQPVKGPDEKVYLVLVEERQAARQKTELDVHDAITTLLTLQKMQVALDALRQKAKTQTFPERLSAVQQ